MTDTPGSPTPEGSPSVRVLVADDQATVREGLVTLLGLAPGIEVVGAAADGAEAIALTADLHPEVVLMDLGMPTVDGVTATARIRAEHPDTQVVVLTTFADDTTILAALNAGALGYLTKDAGCAQITRALHTPPPPGRPSWTPPYTPDSSPPHRPTPHSRPAPPGRYRTG